MFATAEYNRYADFQERADNLYRTGDHVASDSVQAEADQAYRIYEYAAGLKREEDDF